MERRAGKAVEMLSLLGEGRGGSKSDELAPVYKQTTVVEYLICVYKPFLCVVVHFLFGSCSGGGIALFVGLASWVWPALAPQALRGRFSHSLAEGRSSNHSLHDYFSADLWKEMLPCAPSSKKKVLVCIDYQRAWKPPDRLMRIAFQAVCLQQIPGAPVSAISQPNDPRWPELSSDNDLVDVEAAWFGQCPPPVLMRSGGNARLLLKL